MAEKFVGPDQTGDGKQDLNLKEPLAFGYINGGLFIDSGAVGAGTGNYNTFLLLQDAQGGEAGLDSKGFNSNTADSSNPEMGSQSKLTLLRDIPIILHTDGKLYYAFGMDLNEPDNDELVENISLDQFKVYLSSNVISTKSALDALTPIYDMDAGNDVSVLLNAGFSNGSGDDDYSALIPAELFAGKDPATTYLYVYAQFGAADGSLPDTWGETGGFEEVSSQLASSYSGVKFNDHDGQGDRDTGDEGLGGFTLYIDADGDNKFDLGENSAKTNPDGTFTFYNLASGSKLQGNNFATVNYTFREVLSDADRGSGWSDGQWDGFAPPDGAWEQTTDDASGDQTFSITGPNSYSGLLVGNWIPTFDISGTKFNDLNGDGSIAGDPGLGGVRIYVDFDNDSEYDIGEKTDITDPDGTWSITGLTAADVPSGTKVREVITGDMVATLGKDGLALTGAGQTGLNFANFLKFDASGYKWNDLNGDGDWDSGEPGIAKWSITIKGNLDSDPDIETLTVETDANGKYTFTGLGPGSYEITEVLQTGWIATYNQTWSFTGASDTDRNLGTLVTTPGNFGNFERFSISGIKYDDNDNNGIDDGDGRLANVVVYIDTDGDNHVDGDDNDNDVQDGTEVWTNFDLTDGNGAWTISGLGPSVASKEVKEITPAGYTQTHGQIGTVVNTEYLVVAKSGDNSQTSFNFANFKPFDISGVKLIDKFGDGSLAGDTTAHAGVRIYIDWNGNGTYDFDAGTNPKELSDITDADGKWSIAGLDSSFNGKLVREDIDDVLSDYVTTVGASGLAIAGGDQTGIDFGNFEKFDVTGYKWNDLDGDKVWDAGEKAIENWSITLKRDIDNDGFDDGTTTVTTGADGKYSFTNLGPGKYQITEESQTGWTPTYDGTWTFTGESGKNLNATFEKAEAGNFGNFKLFSVSGVKYLDKTGDGKSGDDATWTGDPVTMFIDIDGDGYDADDPQALTGAGGAWTITGLDWTAQGKAVQENVPAGYIQTGAPATTIVATSGNNQTGFDFYNFKPDPKFTIDKVVKDITSDNGGAGGVLLGGVWIVNSADDVINYTVTIFNNGNVALTEKSVTDQLEGSIGLPMGSPLQTGGPGPSNDTILQVGETWKYTFSYAVPDGRLNGANADDIIDNLVTATFTYDGKDVGPQTDDTHTPIAIVELKKLVSTTNGSGYVDADTAATGINNVVNQPLMYFRVTAENNGGTALTNVVITDTDDLLGANLLFDYTLFATPSKGLTAWATSHGATAVVGDTGNDGILGVGETWTIDYNMPFHLGQHVNTADITNAQLALDADKAYYKATEPGPGVRTPGFWGNDNKNSNWMDYWDGDASVPKQEFVKTDLLRVGNTYGNVDSNGSGGAPNGGDVGLLIGDWNKNGITDSLGADKIAGTADDFQEDTIFISLTDAQKLIHSSETASGESVSTLGKHALASWLNYLAGNPVGNEADVNSPRHYLNDAVDWMQQFASNANNAPGPVDFDAVNSALFEFDSAPKGTAAWSAPFSGSADDHTGSLIATELNYYNNLGGTYDPAHLGDPAFFFPYANPDI